MTAERPWPDACAYIKRATARMTAQTRARVQGTFIPLALAGTLLTGFINLIGLAYWAGGLNARTTRNEADIVSTKGDIREVTQLVRGLTAERDTQSQALYRQAVEQAAAMKAIEKRLDDNDRRFALFQDETWGRISRLPYRDPKQR